MGATKTFSKEVIVAVTVTEDAVIFTRGRVTSGSDSDLFLSHLCYDQLFNLDYVSEDLPCLWRVRWT